LQFKYECAAIHFAEKYLWEDLGYTILMISFARKAAMKIGYIYVSRADEPDTLAIQREALLSAGAEQLYQDTALGHFDHRPELTQCLTSLQACDVLLVWQLQKLGKDLRHLLSVMQTLKEKNIGLKVLYGPPPLLDTTTSLGQALLTSYANLAELDQQLIKARTVANRLAAKARVRPGPRKMNALLLKEARHALAAGIETPKVIAARLGISVATLTTYLYSDGSLKAPGRKLLPDNHGTEF
jgi:DNA invertase Pin-like site-specific DNA recombinase